MFINSEMWSARRLPWWRQRMLTGRTESYGWFVSILAFAFGLSGFILFIWASQYVQNDLNRGLLGAAGATLLYIVALPLNFPGRRVKYRDKLIFKGELLAANVHSAGGMVLLSQVYENWRDNPHNRYTISQALGEFAKKTAELPRFFKENVLHFDVFDKRFGAWNDIANFDPQGPLGTLALICDCEQQLIDSVNSVLDRDSKIRERELTSKVNGLFKELQPLTKEVDRINAEIGEINGRLNQVPLRLAPTQHA